MVTGEYKVNFLETACTKDSVTVYHPCYTVIRHKSTTYLIYSLLHEPFHHGLMG